MERNITVEEAVESTTFCPEKCESGQGYALKKDHVYWHQVQGEMYLSHRKFCYFVVWTTKDIAIVKVERDETWVANIPVLTQFYFDNLFPRIVEGELYFALLLYPFECQYQHPKSPYWSPHMYFL